MTSFNQKNEGSDTLFKDKRPTSSTDDNFANFFEADYANASDTIVGAIETIDESSAPNDTINASDTLQLHTGFGNGGFGNGGFGGITNVSGE